MPVLATESDIKNLRHWADELMPIEVWIPINAKQLEAFRVLIAENYGWPVFTLNINRLNNKIMKIIVW